MNFRIESQGHDFKGDSHGILGPQMAASVIASTRGESKSDIQAALISYFGSQKPLVGFSAIGGRDDLVALARNFKHNGVITVLAGPQANVDFVGETGWDLHPQRFKGFSASFSFALHRPAEQFEINTVVVRDLCEEILLGGHIRILQGALPRIGEMVHVLPFRTVDHLF